MADKYAIPARLDDPELIGLWTLDVRTPVIKGAIHRAVAPD
jgi:hypothetical protein